MTGEPMDFIYLASQSPRRRQLLEQLGVRHELPMSAVAEGIAPSRAWKMERYGQDWHVGDSLNASIGQGYVLASPL